MSYNICHKIKKSKKNHKIKINYYAHICLKKKNFLKGLKLWFTKEKNLISQKALKVAIKKIS